MRDTIRLGKVRGVGVGAHWSLAAVVVLLGLGLAHDRLPLDAPGLGGTAYAVAGTATAVGLMVGVLAHEFGHAAVARRAGLGVDGITLSWMGGVTRIEGDTTTPWWELAVAGVGPAVSAGLGGVLLGLRAVIGPSHGGYGALALSAVTWLGAINIGLALFNLVPASPLDGGRILHGVLWRLTGDRWRATRVTSRIGVAFGMAVVAVSFVALARGGGGLNALILAGLGWWLVAAARNEGQVGVVHQALEGSTVADLMRPVGAAPGWATVADFLDTSDGPRPGWVWLLEAWGGGYTGVVAGDAVRALPRAQRARLRTIDVAVPVADTAGAHPGEDALACMARTGGRQVVLVVDGGHTVGAVLPSDVEALVTSGRRPAPVGAPPAGAPGAPPAGW